MKSIVNVTSLSLILCIAAILATAGSVLTGIDKLIELDQEKRIVRVETNLNHTLQVIAEQGYYTEEQKDSVVKMVDWLEESGNKQHSATVTQFMDKLQLSGGKQQTPDSIRHSAPKLHNL